MVLAFHIDITPDDLKTLALVVALWATRCRSTRLPSIPTRKQATVLAPVNRPSTPPSSAPKRALRAGGSPEKVN